VSDLLIRSVASLGFRDWGCSKEQQLATVFEQQNAAVFVQQTRRRTDGKWRGEG
jgi:hypothetical protein